MPNCELNKQVYAVSERISSKTAALIEPFTVGTRAARRSRPQPHETAIVFGAGTIGIGAAIALKYFGCPKVLIVDLSDFRLRKAAALGFETCNSSKEDLNAKAVEVFGEARGLSGPTADIDIFVEAAGADSLLDTYQSMGKIVSRMVVVAVHSTPVPIDLVRLCYAQQNIIGSGGYAPEDVKAVMAIMQSGDYDLESIITHEFPLDEIVAAIETAGDPRHGAERNHQVLGWASLGLIRASATVQFVGVIVLATALVLVVADRVRLPGAPPAWFVGLCETIVALVIRSVMRLRAGSGGSGGLLHPGDDCQQPSPSSRAVRLGLQLPLGRRHLLVQTGASRVGLSHVAASERAAARGDTI